VVHAAAIAATSEYFDALINGGMNEAQKGCARFEDVRVDDFVRFCEFAYRGDYTVPLWTEVSPDPIVEDEPLEPVIEEPQPERYPHEVPAEVYPVEAPPEAYPDEAPPEPYPQEAFLGEVPTTSHHFHCETWNGTSASSSLSNGIYRLSATSKYSKKKGKKGVSKRTEVELDPSVYPSAADCTAEPECAPEPEPEPEPELTPQPPPVEEVPSISRLALRTKFNSWDRSLAGAPLTEILGNFTPESNSTADQDFAPVLLAHARLYAFAHFRLIEPLQALTLDKLHRTLLDFKLFANRIGDIIQLAQYAYSTDSLPDRSNDGTLDELRRLVVEYIVCEVDTIGKHDDFVKLMEEGGEFVGDFWRLARDYMV
jgi:hypothetical protein